MATNNAVNIPTAAAGKVLQGQGVGSSPDFSTSTYPSTATSTGTILRADGTNWVATTATYPSSSGGSGKILYDNGTNFVESTPTFPASASATSRKIIVSDGTNWVASTETYAVPGTSGNVLTSDGTNWTSAAPTGSSYSLQIVNTTTLSPADATTYYVNMASSMTTTVNTLAKLFIPKTGTIKAVYGVASIVTPGTSESVTIAVRVNDTSNTNITTSANWSASPAPFSNGSLSISVTAGDYISIIIISPTWVTNPQFVTVGCTIYIS